MLFPRERDAFGQGVVAEGQRDGAAGRVHDRVCRRTHCIADGARQSNLEGRGGGKGIGQCGRVGLEKGGR
jgi:hypothetical protein